MPLMHAGIATYFIQFCINPSLPMVTGQLSDTPTRGLPTRGLDISRTCQHMD